MSYNCNIKIVHCDNGIEDLKREIKYNLEKTVLVSLKGVCHGFDSVCKCLRSTRIGDLQLQDKMMNGGRHIPGKSPRKLPCCMAQAAQCGGRFPFLSGGLNYERGHAPSLVS